MQKVVIAGGGFAGVAALKTLLKETNHEQVELVLLDKNNYHTFTPSLYEVATSETPLKNIAIPFEEIFGGKVRIEKGLISRVDNEKHVVTFDSGETINYDYLILALGSQTAYYNIKGLKENAFNLKTVKDAVKVKNKVLDLYQKAQKNGGGVRIVIGGGGFSGTELAAEMITYRNKLAKKFGTVSLEVSIIEGSERLLNGLSQEVSEIAKKRLESNRFRIFLNTRIQEVTQEKIFTKDGPVFDYNLLIWTGGIAGCEVVANSGFAVNKKGQLEVDKYLRVSGTDNIFTAGDLACFIDPLDTKPAPAVAQVAQEEGRVAGENVARRLFGKELKIYKLRHFGYVVPLKGRYVVAELGWLHLRGLLAWLVQQVIFLRYLLEILPVLKSLKRWNNFELKLDQN